MSGLGGLRDRYRGTLLGSAVGDALGATVEFMSRDEIRVRHGVHTEIIGGGWLRLPAGEVTDDTQMALCIARSIAELGRFEPDDIARHFVEWYRSDPPDIGNTTRLALRYLDEGLPWHEAGERTHREMRPRDASNGSVMRCAPVALLARNDPEANAEYSAISSRITHANPLAVAGTIALNTGIAALLDDPESDAVTVARAATGDPQVNESLAELDEVDPDTLEAGGYVLATLRASFWALTQHDTFEQAIVVAVNLGQDADTTGAVAGALAGARWGASGIPERWLDALLGRDELTELADGLLGISLAGD
jgi:ADP-ribosyl-[dinitrogen reductase] hydrolase